MMPIKRRVPGLSDRTDYSCALYPDPPSHDFCVWLIIAELLRRYHCAPAPLRVKFALRDGQLGTYDFGPLSPWLGKAFECGMSKEHSDLMIENVLRPAMEMIGAIESVPVHIPWTEQEGAKFAHYVEYDYHIGALIDAGRAGHRIPQWSSPQWAHNRVRSFLEGRKPVVITLRELTAQPERNSQVAEWVKFVHSIKEEYPVVIVRDTCKAEEPFDGLITWPLASRNSYIRAALAQQALVNLSVCTGPAVWFIFSDAPYLMFKQLVPALADSWEHGTALGWKQQDHMDIGDQYPWATQFQRMTWTDDTFENIRDAFDCLVTDLAFGYGRSVHSATWPVKYDAAG